MNATSRSHAIGLAALTLAAVFCGEDLILQRPAVLALTPQQGQAVTVTFSTETTTWSATESIRSEVTQAAGTLVSLRRLVDTIRRFC